MVGSPACRPTSAPGTPTLLSPVRKTLCPVMKDERPAPIGDHGWREQAWLLGGTPHRVGWLDAVRAG
jgi:hypothetical protein